MDISQELERGIGHGPTLPTPEERLATARAALRRRRLLVGSGAAAGLMVAITPLMLGGGPEVHGTGPTPAASQATGAPSRDGVSIFRESIRLARFESDGRLWIHPDTVVHDRRDDVVPGAVASVALDATYDGRRSWLLFLQVDEGSASGIHSGPRDDPELYRTFDEFVTEGARALSRRIPESTRSPDVPPAGEEVR